MNDSAERLEVEIAEGIEKVPREAWDALLAPDDSPFVEWDWLYAMEHSGCAVRKTGWAPYHLLIRDRARKKIVAACPLYLKTHSMGEFVFDHGWSDAADRAGIRYFPKLMVGVPFTPHTGRRILSAPGANRAALINLVGHALATICAENKLSSIHINFCEPEEAAALTPLGFMERLGYQYHWQNAGFSTFDDYLARLKHKRRVAVKHERSALIEQGIEIRVDSGESSLDAMFPQMFQIYLSTIEKLYWGRQYLNEEFFDILRERFKRNVAFIGAYRGKKLVAGAINLQKAGVLYGRYWGCFQEHRFLHFNVCYYAGIEHAIASGIQRYEPGAGGEYKWLRGFDPALTRSVHYVAHPGLRKAIADFLKRERREVERWIETGSAHSQLKPPPPSDQESQ